MKIFERKSLYIMFSFLNIIFIFFEVFNIGNYYTNEIIKEGENIRTFHIPIIVGFFFSFFFKKKYLLRKGDLAIYDKFSLKHTYIRDCYYRVMSEILVCSGHGQVIRNNSFRFSSPIPDEALERVPVSPFVVVGNPGIGKTSLSYLFIRMLMESGAKVCFINLIFIYFRPFIILLARNG
jgi:hypothetical protein